MPSRFVIQNLIVIYVSLDEYDYDILLLGYYQ